MHFSMLKYEWVQTPDFEGLNSLRIHFLGLMEHLTSAEVEYVLGCIPEDEVLCFSLENCRFRTSWPNSATLC